MTAAITTRGSVKRLATKPTASMQIQLQGVATDDVLMQEPTAAVVAATPVRSADYRPPAAADSWSRQYDNFRDDNDENAFDPYLEDDKWLTVNGNLRHFTLSPSNIVSSSTAYSATTLTKSRNLATKMPKVTSAAAKLPRTTSPIVTSSAYYNRPDRLRLATSTEDLTPVSQYFYSLDQQHEIDFDTSPVHNSLLATTTSPSRFFIGSSFNSTRIPTTSLLSSLTESSSYYDDYLQAKVEPGSTPKLMQSLDETCQLGISEWFAIAFMVLLTVSTICMNVIVIILFLSNKNLRSLGNMYYMSLAFADFLIGSIAMPLNIYMQIMCDMWPFSSIACDLFICFDVFSSTASIMHLCVIAIDRYKVIDDPLGYVRRLSRKRVFATIGGIWLTAAAISFPGIAWWRFAGMAQHRTAFIDASNGSVYIECYLAHEVTYIFVSSAVSFYIPLCVMCWVYYKIYQKAVAQSRFLTAGHKHVTTGDQKRRITTAGPHSDPHSPNGRPLGFGRITLRAHRGGQAMASLSLTTQAAQALNSFGRSSKFKPPSSSCSPPAEQAFFNMQENFSHPPISLRQNSSCLSYQTSNVATENRQVPLRAMTSVASRKGLGSHQSNKTQRKSSIFSYQNSYTFFQKLRAILKEHKAARTLGLIMGVFILCWLPFFVLNILSALIPSELTKGLAFKMVFKVFTWCGYMNSVLNPFLYGVSNRTFRNIYINFLTCGRYKDKNKKSSSSASSSAGNLRKHIKPFRALSLPRIEQESLEHALRDPKHHAVGTIGRSTQPSPLPASTAAPPSHGGSVTPTSAATGNPNLLAAENLLVPPAQDQLPSLRALPSSINDIMVRSLTIQMPKRDIGHLSCYCQCADSSPALFGRQYAQHVKAAQTGKHFQSPRQDRKHDPDDPENDCCHHPHPKVAGNQGKQNRSNGEETTIFASVPTLRPTSKDPRDMLRYPVRPSQNVEAESSSTPTRSSIKKKCSSLTTTPLTTRKFTDFAQVSRNPSTSEMDPEEELLLSPRPSPGIVSNRINSCSPSVANSPVRRYGNPDRMHSSLAPICSPEPPIENRPIVIEKPLDSFSPSKLRKAPYPSYLMRGNVGEKDFMDLYGSQQVLKVTMMIPANCDACGSGAEATCELVQASRSSSHTGLPMTADDCGFTERRLDKPNAGKPPKPLRVQKTSVL